MDNNQEQEQTYQPEQTAEKAIDIEAIKAKIEELTAKKPTASRQEQRRLRAKIRDLKHQAGIPLPPRKIREKEARPNKTEQVSRLHQQIAEAKQGLEALLNAKAPITKSQIKEVLTKLH